MGAVESIRNQVVLLSPLNWGLGHVTRTIPIVRELINNENTVVICCNSEQQSIYEQEDLPVYFEAMEGYPFKFTGDGKWGVDLLREFPTLYSFLNREHRIVERLTKKWKASVVISDQRYGFYSKQIKSVIISHQLSLPVSGFNKMGQWLNHFFLKKFSEVWVPDDELSQLSGNLSKNDKLKVKFIGIQSRFSSAPKQGVVDIDSLGIVSGPMPYALYFAESVLNKLNQLSGKNVVVLPDNVYRKLEHNKFKRVTIIVQPTIKELEKLLVSAQIIVSRAGYSTLMDLTVLQKKAILVPTSGQFEQIYLSDYHKNHPLWKFYNEKEFEQLEIPLKN